MRGGRQAQARRTEVSVKRKLLIPLIALAAAGFIAVGAVGALLLKGNDEDHGGKGSAKGYLGVSVNFTPAGGLRVSGVQPDGPAAKAGIQAGDVIRSINGQVVRTPEQLRDAIESKAPGDKVTVTYERSDKEQQAQVKLGEVPENAVALEPPAAAPTPGPQPGRAGQGNLLPNRGQIGVQVENVTPALKQQYSLTRDNGVVVTDVTANSPAAQAGIQKGDIILALNNSNVNTVQEVTRAIGAMGPGGNVTVKLLRGSNEQTVQLTLQRAAIPGLENLPQQLRDRIDQLLQQSGNLTPDQLQRLAQQFQGGGIKAGTVKDASPTSLTITPIGGGADTTISLNDRTQLRRGNDTIAASDLKKGETVLAISLDGQTAVAVISLGTQQLNR